MTDEEIPCRECEAPIPVEASTCPTCNTRQTTKGFYRLIVGASVLFCAVFVGAFVYFAPSLFLGNPLLGAALVALGVINVYAVVRRLRPQYRERRAAIEGTDGGPPDAGR